MGTCQFLLKKGAGLSEVDEEGRCVLHWAALSAQVSFGVCMCMCACVVTTDISGLLCGVPAPLQRGHGSVWSP